MEDSQFFAIDTLKIPWEESFNEKIGKALFRKELFSEPETGMLVRLVRYPAGIINPSHTHPCGHGMYVLEGTLVTHKGAFGPDSLQGCARRLQSAKRLGHGAPPVMLILLDLPTVSR